MALRASFSKFVTVADDVEPINSSFAEVLALLPSPAPGETAIAKPFYERMRVALADNVPFILKRLFQVIDERWNFYSTQRSKVSATLKRAVVSGGGPCGLRAAVELALLGFDVTVIEKRKEFSRHNILKTWMPTVEDLIALGFRNYFPNFKQHGLHAIGTREIQICLLKTALLLGVKVFYRVSTAGLAHPDVEVEGEKGSWRLLANLDGMASLPPLPAETSSAVSPTPIPISEPVPSPIPIETSEEVPAELALKVGEQNADRLDKTSKVDFFEKATSQDGVIIKNESRLPPSILNVVPFDHIVAAEGEASPLIRNLGFDRFVTRFGPAIGVVVNMKFDPNVAAEKALLEFVVLRSQADWAQTCIGSLHEKGVDVENMEYMRFSTHFVVVTVKKESLVRFGVLKQSLSTVRDSLHKDNIDFPKLREFARYLATAAGVPESSPFAAAHGVNIFDFSSKGRLKVPYTLLDSNGPGVYPIGDSLVNPFWPQGLGVNRGFHSSLDAVWSIFLSSCPTPSSNAFTTSLQEAQRERIVSHNMMSWYPLQSSLILPGATWRADPLTRYHPKIPHTMHMNDVEHHNVESSLTPRILAAVVGK